MTSAPLGLSSPAHTIMRRKLALLWYGGKEEEAIRFGAKLLEANVEPVNLSRPRVLFPELGLSSHNPERRA